MTTKYYRFILSLLFAAATFAACSDDDKELIPLPPITPPASTGEQVIALVDQSLNQVALVDAATKQTFWSWTAAQSGLPVEHQAWFDLPDEVKPVYNCKYLLITSTRGGVAMICIEDKKTVFYACPKGQPHSAEVLPDGNIVVASSTDGTADGDKLRLYKVNTSTPLVTAPIATYELKFGHNGVWDRANSLLWATADDVLRCYRYTTDSEGTPALVLHDSYPLPEGQTGAHELFPVYGLNQLWLTTLKAIYKFNVATKEFVRFNASASVNVKSVSSGPAEYPTILLFPTNSYWSDKLIDTGGRSVYQRDGAHIYKGRWMLDNTFSYPHKHEFAQPL